jgi:alkylation response protein AidB-like acyl-CoA dehydrogenase
MRTKVLSSEALDYFARINASAQENDAQLKPICKENFSNAVSLGLYSSGIKSLTSHFSALAWGKHLESLGYHSMDCGLPLLISLRAGLANTIIGAKNPHINLAYAAYLEQGECLPAFAYTDGADPFSFNTVAEKTEQGYLINGVKSYVTGGMTADIFVVYARKKHSKNSDLAVFIIDRNNPGLHVQSTDVAGLRTAGIATLVLKNCLVTKEKILQENDGLSHVQQFLNERRLFLVSPLLGRMLGIFEATLQELDSRIRYGAPVSAMQYVQAQVGKMYQLHASSRAVLYDALQRQDSTEFDPYWDPIASSAKAFVVDSALQLVGIAQRLFGGDGYLRSKNIERYQRDFAGYIPGGGAQDTLQVDLGIHALNQHQLLNAFKDRNTKSIFTDPITLI